MQLQFTAFGREAQCQYLLTFRLSGPESIGQCDAYIFAGNCRLDPHTERQIRIRNVRFLFCSIVSTHHHNAA